jgi:hypothetical protein
MIKNYKTEKIIGIRREDSTNILLNFGVFSGIFYFSYLGVKKLWGVFL